jgi:hypothetical protein
MNRHHPAQWSKVIATRSIEWEDGPEERAVLLVPRFRRGPLAKWLQPRLRRPHMRVKLDVYGSFVWKRCDGSTTFEQIAGEMRTTFGPSSEPAEERLKSFLILLYRDKFIELFTPAVTISST